MRYINSVAKIATNKDNKTAEYIIYVRGCADIAPSGLFNPNIKASYECDEFEICENYDKTITVTTFSEFKHADVKAVNKIVFSDVARIDILTKYDT